ncbi:MAG: HAMP domain-containing histidine kinase [Rubrivivax sp.]|nr:HAMP domain-containing histidine kinase [Rubrivivax sp.]
MRHSLKARLVLLFLLMGIGTAAIFGFGMQRAVVGGWQAFARPLLADYVDRLAAEIGSPPSAARAQALAERLPVRVRIDGPAVRLDTHPQHGDEATNRRRFGGWRDDADDVDDWGLARTTADGHRVRFSLARPPEHWRARGIGWITLGGLLAVTLLAYAAVRRLLRPLEDITVAVERYGRGELGTAIAIRRHDELGDLAARINRMAGSLHGMLEAKRALLLAISHELRSPLTRARLNAELLAEAPERAALLRDLAEMSELITTLLESERLGEGHQALHRERTDLAALLREFTGATAAGAAAAAGQVASAPRVAIDEDIEETDVDPMRVRLLVRNLLDNAARHAAAASEPPTLFLRREPGGALALGVRDHGPGVDAGQLARLGEPFHRPDSARTRGAGGVGLGLHLCRLIAQAHGGELRITNLNPGLDVAMVWQAAPP